MAKLCGAKTRNGGGPCKLTAMANGRCRFHGGMSPGGKPGNTNAVKHGFYSDALLPEEREMWGRVDVGSLDDEIKLAKIKLHRLVRLAGQQDVADLVDSALSVAVSQMHDARLAGLEKQTISVKAPQYADLIVKQLDLVRKLELARVQMISAALDAELKRAEVEKLHGAGKDAAPDGLTEFYGD